VRYTRQP